MALGLPKVVQAFLIWRFFCLSGQNLVVPYPTRAGDGRTQRASERAEALGPSLRGTGWHAQRFHHCQAPSQRGSAPEQGRSRRHKGKGSDGPSKRSQTKSLDIKGISAILAMLVQHRRETGKLKLIIGIIYFSIFVQGV